MEKWILLNGQFHNEDSPFLTARSRAFKYGEGVFETIRLEKDRLCFFQYHLQRLLHGITFLGFDRSGFPAERVLEEEIRSLLDRNQMPENARVRLTVFRGEEDLCNHTSLLPNRLIETFFMEPFRFCFKGTAMSVYTLGKKSNDAFSNLKSNQYLLSAMSLMDAARKQVDEQILLNCFERVCEASKANVFCIYGDQIVTPPLTEGCVAGVVRKYLLQELPRRTSFRVSESPVTLSDLFQADEVFLTNALRPVRRVAEIDGRKYAGRFSAQIAKNLFEAPVIPNQ